MITVQHLDCFGPRYLLTMVENGEVISSSSFELWNSPVEAGHMKIYLPLQVAIREVFPSAQFGTGFGWPAINLSDVDTVKLKLLAD